MPPHGPHHFRRVYLGPTAVPAAAAQGLAQAIAADEAAAASSSAPLGFIIATPRGPRPGIDAEDVVLPVDEAPPAFEANVTAPFDAAAVALPPSEAVSPKSDRIAAPFLRLQRRHLSREASAASFASAHSLPVSVLSEGDATGRPAAEARKALRRGLRRDASAMGALGRDIEADGANEDSQARQALPLLDLPVAELNESDSESAWRTEVGGGPSSPPHTPARKSETRAARGAIGEHLTIDTNVSPITPRRAGLAVLRPQQSDASMVGKGPPSRREQMRTSLSASSLTRSHGRALAEASVPRTEGALSVDEMRDDAGTTRDDAGTTRDDAGTTHDDADTTRDDGGPGKTAAAQQAAVRAAWLKERARARLGAGVGHPPHSRSASHGRSRHPRDVSRASRMSRASTVGTFGTEGSVATRFTEGSFGASGGVRARLFAALGIKDAKDRRPSRDVPPLPSGHKRHGSEARVGTSGGGTKWVGGSYEVGKRFWQVVEARREALAALQSEADLSSASYGPPQGDAARIQRETPAAEESAPRNADDVLSSMAKEAQEKTDDKVDAAQEIERQGGDAQQITGLPSVTKQPDPTPAAPGGLTVPADRTLRNSTSAASLISVPQTRGAEHESSFAIESRQGWSDVVSLMSAQSASKASSRFGLGTSGKKMLEDSRAGLESFRARQAERRKKETAITTLREDSAPPDSTRTQHLIESPGTMTPLQSRAHPEPPLAAEDKFPEAIHELLRRQSDAGQPVDGRDETASDHEVVVGATEEGRLEMGDAPADAKPAARPTAAPQRKTVQFESRSDTGAAGRNFTASLFARGQAAQLSAAGRPLSGDDIPAPPEEVLSRQGSFERLPEEEAPTRRTALKRDRMLVKLGWTPSTDVPADFDENAARKVALYGEPWREYIVLLRMGRLEIWDDPTFTSKALGHASRLKLRHIVPLRRGSTYLSLYSPIDRIFAVSYAAGDGDHKGKLHLRRSGTHVVLFDARSRTVAADWMWELWRELGGTIPETLEVHVPALDVRVRIPIPDEVPTNFVEALGRGEGFKLMTRGNLISTVLGLAREQADWREMITAVEHAGVAFELAWRTGTTLDWVREDTTVDGKARDWAVLCGSVVKESHKLPSLELRAATHYPTFVKSATGQLLEEPPAIEGFLWRVKPVSGALSRLYATTHDGHIFVCRPTRAFPPDRHLATMAQQPDAGAPARSSRKGNSKKKRRPSRDEGLASLRDQVITTASVASGDEDSVRAQALAFEALECRRQLEQISQSDGYVDLRDVRVVRSCGDGPVRRPSVDDCADPHVLPDERASGSNTEKEQQHQTSAPVHRDGMPADGADHANTDLPELVHSDIGGEEGLAAAADRAVLRRARQFEIVMANGRATRFEAYSARIAHEWIERLAALARYWKRREKIDALELMNASGYDPAKMHRRFRRAQQGVRVEDDDDQGVGATFLGAGADAERISPMLSSLWNWCVLQGCRGIVRSGRLFHKRKAYTPFASRHYVLIAGRLLNFSLVTSVRTARSRQNAGIFHRRNETVVHLRDAYVYSGKLSEEMLTNGRSEAAGAVSGQGGGGGSTASTSERHRLPRVYRDGLLSIDEDEDCTFVVRYRPQRLQQPADPQAKLRAGAKVGQVEQTTVPASATSLPSLGDKAHKHLVLRARSRLERDLWVRAIALEIERLVRDDRERENNLREAGKTPYK